MDHQKRERERIKKKDKRPLKDNLYFINAGKITLLLTCAIILPTLKTETSGMGGVGKRRQRRPWEEDERKEGEKKQKRRKVT